MKNFENFLNESIDNIKINDIVKYKDDIIYNEDENEILNHVGVVKNISSENNIDPRDIYVIWYDKIEMGFSSWIKHDEIEKIGYIKNIENSNDPLGEENWGEIWNIYGKDFIINDFYDDEDSDFYNFHG